MNHWYRKNNLAKLNLHPFELHQSAPITHQHPSQPLFVGIMFLAPIHSNNLGQYTILQNLTSLKYLQITLLINPLVYFSNLGGPFVFKPALTKSGLWTATCHKFATQTTRVVAAVPRLPRRRHSFTSPTTLELSIFDRLPTTAPKIFAGQAAQEALKGS